MIILVVFQRDTVYKCRVYNDRDTQVNGTQDQPQPPELVTEIEIPVYVAENLSDTCEVAFEGGILWPRTKKVWNQLYRNKFLDGGERSECIVASFHKYRRYFTKIRISACVTVSILHKRPSCSIDIAII